MSPQLLPPARPAIADVLHLVKAQALQHMRHTTAEDLLFVLSVLIITLAGLAVINGTLLGNTLQLRRPSIPSFFVAIYIVLMSLPATVWFYATPQDPIRYTYFLAMQSVLWTFPFGMVCANIVYGDLSKPARVVRRFFSDSLEKSLDDRRALRYWVLMILASTIVATVYLMTSPYVPLIGAITSYGVAEASTVRRAVVAEGVTIHYGHALTARLFLPFCLLYAYFMAYLYGGRWRLLFWPTLGVAAFVSALTFDRMFPFSVMLFLVLAVYFKYSDLDLKAAAQGRSARRRLSKLRLLGYVIALLSISMLVGGIVSLTQFNKPIDLEIIQVESIAFFINRVGLDPSYMAYLYFMEFNEPSKFVYGKSIHVLVSRAFGVEFYPTISPSFVAELWVNFGWLGVLVGSALVGFVLQLIQVCLFDRKTVPALSLYLIMLLNGAWIIYGHLLATMVISVYVPSILILISLKRRRRRAEALAAGRVSPSMRNIVPHSR
jgi:O-antigen polysaccharide polymerase Wzy